MANVKISQLPAASSITANVDVAPLVSGGVTTKATPQQIVNSVLPSPGPIGSVSPSTGQFTQIIGVGLSGLVKATSGVFVSAVSGVDYAPATSGSSILSGNSTGGFSNVSIGSGLSFSAGTLSATTTGTVSSVGLSMPGGFSVANSPITSSGTIAVTTSLNGLIKGNGSGFTTAASGTDYAPATSGTNILYGNGAGGFNNATVGANLSFVSGVLSCTVSGTVTNCSVVSANGFAGTVANNTTTPAITLTTTVTGLIKGNGTALSAATAGTDYAVAPTGSNAQLLANNGSGGFSNVNVGSGLSYSAGTLSATAGGGTVTSVSGTGTVSGLTLTGTVTSSGSLTLGGALDLSAPPAIGGTTPAAGAFTTLSSTGNTTIGDAAGDTLTINAGTTTFAGTGQRITGDMSNATIANRLAFQTSTANGQTSIGVLPNGTSTSANLNLFGSSDPANASIGQLVNTGTEVRLSATITGTGSYLPMTFYTGGSERVRIDTSGNVGIGTSSPGTRLHVEVSGAASVITNKGTSANYYGYAGSTLVTQLQSASTQTFLNSVANVPLVFGTNDTERMRLDSSGNLGLGVAPNSGWSSAFGVLDIKNYGALSTGNDPSLHLTVNAYYNGASWAYKAGSIPAVKYSQYAGGHYWYTATSGTAGAAFTFTQAMTLTAGNNLLLGGTSDPGGSICIYIANRSSVPGTPSGGGVIYVEAGALKYKGSSGTITTLGAA